MIFINSKNIFKVFLIRLNNTMITFTSIKAHQFKLVFDLAKEIWNTNYHNMIGQAQIDYMLNRMYNPAQLQQDLAAGYQWELIHLNEEIIGYLAYIKNPDNRIFLSKIYLKITAQGRGFGRIALQRVKDYGRSKNCRAVYLTVNRGNTKGIRAYKKTGFKIIAEEDVAI